VQRVTFLTLQRDRGEGKARLAFSAALDGMIRWLFAMCWHVRETLVSA
jgi:hypothetical protein